MGSLIETDRSIKFGYHNVNFEGIALNAPCFLIRRCARVYIELYTSRDKVTCFHF